jgi:hypothetical protein
MGGRGPLIREEVTQNMSFKRKFAILAVPALLALAGGAVAVHAASTPKPAPAATQNDSGTENQAGETEAANQAGEVETANQAGDQGQSGHNDTGAQADHQFDGNE